MTEFKGLRVQCLGPAVSGTTHGSVGKEDYLVVGLKMRTPSCIVFLSLYWSYSGNNMWFGRGLWILTHTSPSQNTHLPVPVLWWSMVKDWKTLWNQWPAKPRWDSVSSLERLYTFIMTPPGLPMAPKPNTKFLPVAEEGLHILTSGNNCQLLRTCLEVGIAIVSLVYRLRAQGSMQ